MQIRKSHRILAAVLTLVMLVGLLPTAAFAKSAGNDGSAEMNEAYGAHESLMPIGPSFNVDTLLEWTPESDPDAVYSRASIPLADRVGGFVVNPKVNPEAKLMLCSLANSDHDHTSAQGTESFLSYAFNYWQYATSFVYWSGSEEGLVCCPTGEFTDAAHTNGVPVVATLGFPWGRGDGYVEQVRQFVQKAPDGSFPVADKLIEVMDYYGFDGYFFNQESYDCTAAEGALIDEMMRYMHKMRPDMLISWYDSMVPAGGVSYQNAVNDANKQFMTDSEDGTRAIDEFLMNYNWYENQVDTTISTMQSIGRSEFDAFAGLDVQQNCMNTPFRDHLLVDANGITRLSLALYCPNSTLGLSTSGENFHEVEQVFYTNAKGDPRDDSVDLTTDDWAGISRFFADHTVITGAPFVTDFNSGHGKGYYVDGQLSRKGEWSYQSNQDVMPTWTWIIDSEGEKLSGGYDFNDAYNGGNSIRFYGNLTGGQANRIMLYSTRVAVEESMKLGLTYKGDQGLVKLVAYYGDESTTGYEACQQVAYDLTAGTGDWTTTEVDLSASAGKILYAIGLQVESSKDVTGYQVNLGRLTLTEQERAALHGPASVTLDEILYRDAYTAEARVYWTPVEEAASYEIYQVNADGTRSLIMETPSTAYYIPTLNWDGLAAAVNLEVVPVNGNGIRGEATALTIPWAYGNGDSEKIEEKYFDNVCLNAKVTGVSKENAGEPASKALDGTAANGSKWCAGDGTTEGWMSIDIGREATVRRWRVEHAEYGGESAESNTLDFSLEYKDASGSWVEVKRIQDNHAAVTDILLDEPVTAQEWKLVVYDDGNSPWAAVRIYEWQMFETAEFPQTTPVPMQFASAVNGEGATDSVTLQHVTAGDTVKVYTKSAGEYTLIGEQVADGSICVLDNLDFGTAEAGRIYYTTTTTAAQESVKMSAPFEAESAEQSSPATEVSFEKYSHPGSVTSSNGSDIYTTLTVQGLEPGDVVYVYENGPSAGYTRASLPVAQGETSVLLRNIRVTRAGGTLSMQVKRTGERISDVYTVETPVFAEPEAVLTLDALDVRGEKLTGVCYGIYNEAGERISEITTAESGGSVSLPLGAYILKCESVPEGYSPNREKPARALRIEGWTYPVTVSIPDYADPAVSEVAVSPADPVMLPGEELAFQAAVTGVGDYSEDVTWTVEGARSTQTGITSQGHLTVGADETAPYLTVTATAVQDGATCCKVTVVLPSLVNIAEGAQVFIYNGTRQGGENGPEKLVDGDKTTKWQEPMGSDSFLLAGLYLGKYYKVYGVNLYHAGSAGEDVALNTSRFYVRSINENQQFDTDFWLGYGASNSAYYVGRNPDYYVEHGVYDGNTENVTALTFAEPVETRSMLVQVTVPNGGTDQDVRLYELEVLAVDEDQVAARRVMAKIDAIGQVTKDSGAAIAAAREAYDALTETQKAQVSNYQTLLDAEKTYELCLLVDAAEAAKRAAEDAQKKAEEARIAAEEAQKAAEAAAGSAADDKEAAEAAKAAAEAAREQAKLAEAAARAAQEAAEAAAKAAEESNQAAAKEAGKAAEEAQKAADEAANAAKSAREAAEASEAAQTAQDKAEEAQRTAEEAQKAAKEAAEAAAQDKTAAEAARVKAEEAQKEAEAARDAAEEAKDAANAAREAAEAHNLAAAEEARKAAEEATQAAISAAEAVESAKLAAQAMVKAQVAQAAAEEAARVAKEAQEKAEEAQRKAEEAAGSTAEDKEAAQKAAQEAKEAKEAAEAAQGAAEEAQKAAETARKAAEDANVEAAASAALAAEYAQKVTETYNEIVRIKAEMVEFLADAQKAAEKAEEERKAAEEAQKKAEEAALAAAKSQALIELALMDTTGCNAEQKEAAAAVLAAAREAIQAAETREEVAALLAEAQEAMEEAMNLVCASDLFRDVAENTWYHEGVDYMVRRGYMDGMGGGLFGVNGTMTRGQMVTILYRIAGKPSVEGLENPFRDVAEGRYYTDAVIWAAANGIVEGMEEGVFAPERAVTRQQVAVILYRHSGAEAGNEDLLSSYPDGKQVAPYARQAMNWAVSQGLIRGVDNGEVTTLSPAATATRAQMATIFLRYLEAG